MECLLHAQDNRSRLDGVEVHQNLKVPATLQSLGDCTVSTTPVRDLKQAFFARFLLYFWPQDLSQRLRNGRRIHLGRFLSPGHHSGPVGTIFVILCPTPYLRIQQCELLGEDRSLLFQHRRCLLFKQDKCLLSKQDRWRLLKQDRCLLSRQDRCLSKVICPV